MIKVSVIIPAYNAEKYIEQTIESVINQTIKNIEIIIVDDCSKDNTPKIIDKWIKKDNRIKKITNKKNLKKSGSVNQGIKLSSGEYISILDSDDLFKKDKLEKQTEYLDKNKDIDFVYSDFEIMNGSEIKILESIDFKEKNPKEIMLEESKKEYDLERQPYKILDFEKKDKFIPACSILIRKSIFDNGIKLDENLNNSEDYDLWLQIIGNGHKVKRLPFVSYTYRKHQDQKSKNKEKMNIAAKIINQKLKNGDYFN